MLAVFPLNLTILPEESVALHLFEPRYRQLYADHKSGKEFVILYQNKGVNSAYGTLVRIERVIEEFPDGTVDVIVKGVQVAKILSFEPVMQGKLYAGVEIEKCELFADASEQLISDFTSYLTSIQKSANKPSPFSLYYVANRLQLSHETKNELMGLPDDQSVNAFLINEIRFLRKIREQEASLNHNFHLN